ncbi:MAG: transporter, partial [Rhodobacterales bacterium]
QLVRNPLIQSGAIGLALLLSGTRLPEPIEATLDLIGRGALGVGILAIGAGMTPRRFLRPSPALLVSLLMRPGLSFLAVLSAGWAFGLPPVQLFCACMALTVPAAANGYIVARQMGGDGELYADGMAWQLLLSLALLPALAAWLLA